MNLQRLKNRVFNRATRDSFPTGPAAIAPKGGWLCFVFTLLPRIKPLIALFAIALTSWHNSIMNDLTTIKTLFRYSDWATEQLVRAAAGLTPEQLDKGFDIGLGSLRKILLHILAGETVWLKRWQGQRETPWPDENEPATPGDIAARFASNARERNAFLNSISPEKTGDRVIYRDSKGSLFSAALADMMIQMFTHSTHHRAQAVNVFRRLGATAPELDYMMWVRKPA